MAAISARAKRLAPIALPAEPNSLMVQEVLRLNPIRAKRGRLLPGEPLYVRMPVYAGDAGREMLREHIDGG